MPVYGIGRYNDCGPREREEVDVRIIAIVLVLTLTTCAAVANPIASSMYVEFEQPGGPNEIAPDAYSLYEAYIVLLTPAIYPPIDGLGTISFRVALTPGMSLGADFMNLLPGDLSIGYWDTGIVLGSSECVRDDFFPVARLDVWASGLEGTIALLPHPEWAAQVEDCSGGVSYWESLEEEGAWGHVLPAPDPVESVSWSAIKAMYR